jgi:LysR family transcriptional regulator of abg operon
MIVGRWQIGRGDLFQASLNMKLHHLRNIMAIAEQGGLRAASRHLRLAQPALTRSLGELERELGAALFERHARGMTLTAMGEVFVQRARAILHEVRRAREEVDQLQGGTRGRVAIALSIAAHIALLPKALSPFRARYPGVQLRIIEGLYPTLEGGLRDGSIDFYVGPEPGRSAPSDLKQETLFYNTRTVLGRRNHPLAGATSLAELADAEWATTSITLQAEEEMGELFRLHGLGAPRLALQSQSALTLIITLAHTDLLAMVPVQWMDFAPMAGILQTIQVREILPAPSIVLIHRAGLPLTPAATYLLDMLRRAAPSP